MAGYLCVMAERDNAVVEIIVWGYIDVAMEVQESILVGPLF